MSGEEMEQNLRKNLKMMKFVGVLNQNEVSVPDATTICRFRLYIAENGLWQKVLEVEVWTGREPRGCRGLGLCWRECLVSLREGCLGL